MLTSDSCAFAATAYGCSLANAPKLYKARLSSVDYFYYSPVKKPGCDSLVMMGKSEGEGNTIFLFDAPEVIRKKVMKAVTDSGPIEPNQLKPQAIENLFGLMKALSEPETLRFF